VNSIQPEPQAPIEPPVLPHEGPARIAPLKPSEFDNRHVEALGPLVNRLTLPNVFATFVKSPLLFRKFSPFANYILNRSTLSPRQREMVVIRAGYKNGCAYELSKHLPAGRRAGLSEHELESLVGPEYNDGGLWQSEDAALITAVDELMSSHTISDTTWAALESEFSEDQIIDVLFTAGAYTMVSWALNAFRVQLDAET